MALAHELVGEPSYDAFGTAVQLGRNALDQRCHLRNSHCSATSFLALPCVQKRCTEGGPRSQVPNEPKPEASGLFRG